ncbi:hypothetical protein [Janthinobacterium sp. ROICE36]|uniref:hypothetical protein n=1 Tax=Janthinobacterium sp. ROICE36 TaxID=2048670 RepID=UPI0011AEF387|nr:hypothetical protein [Janthinobacterium sp. ROICE36]
MLTLFSRAQVNTWLLLESDPLVVSYCERPLIIPDIKPKPVVDFWSGYAGRDELWLVSRDPNPASIDESLPSFTQWARANKYEIRQLPPPDEVQSKVYLENWGLIVRDLSANGRYINPALLKSVRDVLQQQRSIGALCSLLPEVDPILVRVAAYSMLHSGVVSCTNIATRELGPASLLELV